MAPLPIFLVLFGIAAPLPDGTVVVLENSNAVVEAYTHSEVTHVAMILNEGGAPWVFEATPKEVRKLKFSAYISEMGQINRGRRASSRMRMKLYQPAERYSDREIQELRSYLHAQLGRRYSVKGYVRNKPVTGVHCADLVSSALTRTGRYAFDRSYAVSPGELATRIQPHSSRPLVVDLPMDQPAGSWCERSWNWWAGAFAWCGWASWESLTFAF